MGNNHLENGADAIFQSSEFIAYQFEHYGHQNGHGRDHIARSYTDES